MQALRLRFAHGVIWKSALVVLALLGAGIAVAVHGCNNKPPVDDPVTRNDNDPPLEQHIHEFCSACHAFPSPGSFTRSLWPFEINQAYGFHEEFKPNLKAPNKEAVLRYFQERSPEKYPDLVIDNRATTPLPVRHEVALRAPAMETRQPPFLSNIQYLPLQPGGKPQLLGTEMNLGMVLAMDPSEPKPAWRVLGKIPNPARTQVVDLDEDGINDLLVADLGNFLPTEEKKGNVFWLKGKKDGTYEEPISL